jgi:hypothetical protein
MDRKIEKRTTDKWGNKQIEKKKNGMTAEENGKKNRKKESQLE